ncbi:hypothetical protein [Thioalkalivibrio sp. HK1]|uniref:hypothetical protein n=1 Tax=Thioalkalivibrio sp. HK1 TaxID=1469245 RepID=UPI0012DBD83F|nr:hypothetical protein [Thioalkalivibrio sp. HK1]
MNKPFPTIDFLDDKKDKEPKQPSSRAASTISSLASKTQINNPPPGYAFAYPQAKGLV